MNFYQVEPGLCLAVDSLVSIGVVAGWTAILSSHCPSSGRRRFSHRREAVHRILHGGSIASETHGGMSSVGLRLVDRNRTGLYFVSC